MISVLRYGVHISQSCFSFSAYLIRCFSTFLLFCILFPLFLYKPTNQTQYWKFSVSTALDKHVCAKPGCSVVVELRCSLISTPLLSPLWYNILTQRTVSAAAVVEFTDKRTQGSYTLPVSFFDVWEFSKWRKMRVSKNVGNHSPSFLPVDKRVQTNLSHIFSQSPHE
jgi:hypothetical protein